MLDAECVVGYVCGLLHGILVIVKDNFDVVGILIMVGFVVLENFVFDKDLLVVVRLRAVGAILFGKVNLSEFVNFFISGMLSGYFLFGGQVLNLIDVDMMLSGLLFGFGVVVVIGLVMIMIGIEMSGSIISLVVV